MENERKVCFIYDNDYLREMNRLPRVEGRAYIVHELIKAYRLLESITILKPCQATEEELKSFHTEEYVEFLKKIEDISDLEKEDLLNMCEQFGLDYDCPVVNKHYTMVTWQAGGTLTAARALLNSNCTISVNWEGGWHHAKKDEAAGFCYINDPVLAILELRSKFDKVLYIDFDLHHGDGVEDAFAFTKKVMVVSFHKYGEGFFPGTGAITNVGCGKGRYYSVNVPLHDGITDFKFCNIITRILNKVYEKFRPDVIVCQCGVDTLSNDPMESFNLTNLGIGNCLKLLLSWKLPLLVLGGGGYNFWNAARCWCYLTGVLLGIELNPDIPDHKFFLNYGPDYELNITPGNRPDKNSNEYIEQLVKTVLGNLDFVC
ncbi:histone deacetylase 8-like isoform X1 [Centruroides sculpturatus]|uniref:histone deacetylase 8-like isoform X1 n=2 Tax=Centruroides sculpturatus TaxID=218467 RepID=UPI000C6D9F8D|nr:histone deacetylase 8-like isoform X1 [Centruroides sculpturatus]